MSSANPSPSDPKTGAPGVASSSARRSVPWRAWFALVRPEAGPLGTGLVLAAVGSSATLAFPSAVGLLVDGATSAGLDASGLGGVLRPLVSGADGAVDLERLGLVLLVLFVVSSTCLALRYLLLANAGERIVRRLRARLFAAVLRQDFAYLDREGTGELTSRLAADCTKVQGVLTEGLVGGLRATVVALAGGALLFVQSPGLTGIMLAGLPPVCLLALVLGTRLGKLSKTVQDELARSNAVAEQRLANVPTLRLLGAAPLAERVYGTAIEAVARAAFVRNRWAAALTGGAMLGVYVAMGVVIWFGARWMRAGELSPGSLVAFAMLSAFVAGALTEIASLWNEVSHARGSTERLEEIASRVPQLPKSGDVRIDGWRGDFEMRGVEFVYPTRPDVPVLRGLDLALEPGHVLALVGPSGGGKSTVVALLARLREPTGGSLTFGGVSADDVDVEWLRTRVAVVPQEPVLFAGTLRENLAVAREHATEAELAAVLEQAHATEFVAAWPEGLETKVGEGGRQLSGGQRQRIALARALLRDPVLLILDEATSHLDAASERHVTAALDEAARGRSVVVVAHRLATVLRAHEVAVIEGGRVVERGAPAALREQGGLFARWLGWQSTGPSNPRID
jgi:ABC-type multidrug transport system fused ATPase/permease subunit